MFCIQHNGVSFYVLLTVEKFVSFLPMSPPLFPGNSLRITNTVI